MIRMTALAALTVVAQSAVASTPGAWARLERAAKQSCLEASDFNRPKASAPVIFADDVGKIAILISGTYRPAHMRGARGTALCLYDRETRTSATEEVSGWGDVRVPVTPRY